MFMKRRCTLLGILFAFGLLGAEKQSGLLEVESGTAAFEAATNVPGVEVKGVSNALNGHAVFTRDGNTLLLEQVRVVLAVKTLSTGMKVRDEHMRKYIFTDKNGQEPDLEFTAENTTCQGAPGGNDVACAVAGTLSIRGASRPWSINLTVKQSSGAFHASGNGVVKLSDFGIPCPSQFGVSTTDEVKLHLSFTAREKAPVAATAGAAQ